MGFKILNFNIFFWGGGGGYEDGGGGVRKMNLFWGMKILWMFFFWGGGGLITKLD